VDKTLASGSVGFLSDPRRVNVMLTRAKRGLVVVGNHDTLSREQKVWGRWLAWAHSAGAMMLPLQPPGFPMPAPHAVDGGISGHGEHGAALAALDADDVTTEDAAAVSRRVLAEAEARTAAARRRAEAKAGGLLRTSTRQTSPSDESSPRLCTSIQTMSRQSGIGYTGTL
jgi:hypothetical protein